MKGWFLFMRKILTVLLIVLAFTTTVTSSKSEVSYEIYYNDSTLDLISIINHLEDTYSLVTMNTDKDDVDVMVRLKLDDFSYLDDTKVAFEENKIKLYMCDEEDVVFTYKGYFQDYCSSNVKKKGWLDIWGL